MKAAFYSGTRGLVAQQQAMDTIGNNLANVNTNGYLSQGISFQSLLKNEMSTNAPSDPLTAYGVKAISSGLTLGTGTLRATSEPLDFAIQGEGFFAIENNGETQFTKDGAFNITLEDDEPYLATLDGCYVLNSDLERIEMPMMEDSETEYNYEALKEEIGVFHFRQPSALSPAHGNRYGATAESGEAIMQEEGKKIMQGYVAGSTASVVDEMTNMIAAQRVFQISAKVVQTADENEQTINGLRR